MKKMNASVDQKLLDAIRSYGALRAILFGSRARGTADSASDIDLVLIKATTKPFVERLTEFARLVPNDLPRVDAFIYTPEEFTIMTDWENPLVERALAEGKIIYEVSP